jgi:cysteine sulfinate desulfinase/cysteine desulfurase-like protein
MPSRSPISAWLLGFAISSLSRYVTAMLMEHVRDPCGSAGSTCSSAEIEPSYVLRALGLSGQEAGRTLRIGVGGFTSAADADCAVAALSAARAACEAA